MKTIKLCRGKAAFTLIELLVVIAIIAMLLAVLVPSLRKAKEYAQSVICRNHLRTLVMANQIYATRWNNWYVSMIDTTMTTREEPTWNSNSEFRDIVGLQDRTTASSYVMPKEYLCPADRQSNEAYWAQAGVTYKNYVSYGYNLTDWGSSSKNPAAWSGSIPKSTWSCRLRINDIVSPATKIMFVDGGDIWVTMTGANYKIYWDKLGQDIVEYRKKNMWYPVYYRHNEGANVAFFDMHVDYLKKDKLFNYTDILAATPNEEWNEAVWFCDPRNRKN